MKSIIGILLCIVSFCCLSMRSSAQELTLPSDKFPKRAFTPSIPGHPTIVRTTRYKIPGKRASQYTAEDWGKVIDSTWGPGQTAAQQLNVFDTFWNAIDQQWSGFPNLPVNWDSLRTVYRAQIGSGLSRGRFFSIMSRMWLALLEHHTWICDDNVESIFGTTTNLQYKSGIPLLCIVTGWLDLLGAAVTPMPDSSGLVYRITPGNPLGLVPGDLVLGYEGIPWKRLYTQLLDRGVPVSNAWSSSGSTPESRTHEILSGVGWNWGLFDTIDVVKYSTGDTLHLPTAPLATVTPTLWATEQVPIAGVSMPQGCYINETGPAVSYGVVQGTNIGYVYVWDWRTASTPQLFHDAIYDLRTNKNVDGLVLDSRTNWGGGYACANGGFSQLFNFDPSSDMCWAERSSTSDHFAFSISSVPDFPDLPSPYSFTPTAHPFDRPIAVLIGPASLSMGDWNSFRMRFHPMARLFGKPTNGAFVGGRYATGTIPDAWSYNVPTNLIYSNVPGEGYLVHKGVQPDELVWLTRDGVAKGKDDVVERALSWIRSLAYAHDVTIDRSYVPPHLDSVLVTARLTNPLNHSAVLSAIVTDVSGVVRDSILLYNDGKHGDGQAGDSVWGSRIPVPADKGVFAVSLRSDDMTQASYRRLPNITGFATAGPLTLTSVKFSPIVGGGGYSLTPYVRNNDPSFMVWDATVTLLCNDPWVTSITSRVDLPDLLPGATAHSTSPITVFYKYASYPGYFNLKAEISFGSVTYWTDSIRIVTGIKTEEALPAIYALEQNYPNPFNPATTIRYCLPHRSQVLLTVYSTLGQRVATLVQGQKEPGSYEVTFEGSALASGVYFYRIQAGSFVDTKRFLLLR